MRAMVKEVRPSGKFLSRGKCPIRSQTRRSPYPRRPGELCRPDATHGEFIDLGTPKPPFVPGSEVAGVKSVAEGGKASEGEPVRPGEAVAALTVFNAYAQWVSVPAGRVCRLPAGMPFEDGARRFR